MITKTKIPRRIESINTQSGVSDDRYFEITVYGLVCTTCRDDLKLMQKNDFSYKKEVKKETVRLHIPIFIAHFAQPRGRSEHKNVSFLRNDFVCKKK